MLLLIDNYDSFTYNLVHYLGELGADVAVHRNDAIDVQAAMALKPSGIVLSPGPGYPESAGICLALTEAAAETRTPLFRGLPGPSDHRAGLWRDRWCSIRISCMASWARSTMTARVSSRACPRPLKATRYHSLVVDRASLPEALAPTAWLADGTIMGLKHRDLPIEGVQFHPESIRSEHGHKMLKTFLETTSVPV